MTETCNHTAEVAFKTMEVFISPAIVAEITGVSPGAQRQIRNRAGFVSRTNEDGSRQSGYCPFDFAKFMVTHAMMNLGVPVTQTAAYTNEAAISALFFAMCDEDGGGGIMLTAHKDHLLKIAADFYVSGMFDQLLNSIARLENGAGETDLLPIYQYLARTDESGWHFVNDLDDLTDVESEGLPMSLAYIDLAAVGHRLPPREHPLYRMVEEGVAPEDCDDILLSVEESDFIENFADRLDDAGKQMLFGITPLEEHVKH